VREDPAAAKTPAGKLLKKLLRDETRLGQPAFR